MLQISRKQARARREQVTSRFGRGCPSHHLLPPLLSADKQHPRASSEEMKDQGVRATSLMVGTHNTADEDFSHISPGIPSWLLTTSQSLLVEYGRATFDGGSIDTGKTGWVVVRGGAADPAAALPSSSGQSPGILFRSEISSWESISTGTLVMSA